MSPKDEESPADYNYGGYLQVKVGDAFKDGRYTIVRKLGCALFPLFRRRPVSISSSWGHFSTVWLVKDSLYVISPPHSLHSRLLQLAAQEEASFGIEDHQVRRKILRDSSG